MVQMIGQMTSYADRLITNADKSVESADNHLINADKKNFTTSPVGRYVQHQTDNKIF